MWDVVLNAVCLGDVKAYLPWLSHELRDVRSDDLHEFHFTHSLMRAKNAWVKQAARYDELCAIMIITGTTLTKTRAKSRRGSWAWPRG